MLKSLALISAALLLGVSVAQGADAPLIVDEEIMDLASPTIWDGFYAGVGMSGAYYAPASETMGFIDGYVGANMSLDSFVLGAEAWLSGWRSNIAGPGVTAGVEGRAGYLVTPELLAYASLGAMHFFQDNGAYYGQFGLGAEFAVSQDMSVDLEYKHWREIGGTQVMNSVSASVLWHF